MAMAFRRTERKSSGKFIFFSFLSIVFIANRKVLKQLLINELERSRNGEEIFERLILKAIEIYRN